LIHVVKSKIHRVKVTEANLHYIGSLTVDQDLMDAAGMIENEKVQVVNLHNGSRLETYLIPGERKSGVVCLNGAAARLVQPGDLVLIISYGLLPLDEAKSFKPTVIFPDSETNALVGNHE
jgi:aspartate 1-decarboxylase